MEFADWLRRPADIYFLDAARLMVCLRWISIVLVLGEVHYRVDLWTLSHLFNVAPLVALVFLNGYIQWRLTCPGSVSPILLLPVSAVGVVAVSVTVSLSGGFNSPYFPLYGLSLAGAAYLFRSVWFIYPWTTLVAGVYCFISLSVEPVMDFSARQELHLFYRVMALYLASVGVTVVSARAAVSARRAMDRVRELHRQRVEISQRIHDTSAQWAYMVGLGTEQATELVESHQRELAAKLALVSELSRAAMWDLRHPIDGGQLFRGEALHEVLDAHVSTFSVISSVHAEFVLVGRAPPIAIIARAQLFSVAHNALTNVLRHADARRVVVTLECCGRALTLSVSDDGRGLPPDYLSRGHGFRNMSEEACRLGGSLVVDSTDGVGTVVRCVVPNIALIGDPDG